MLISGPLDAWFGARQAAPGPGRSARLQPFVQLMQGVLQGFLEHWVVERHGEHVPDAHPVLDAPGEQVGQVLAARADHGPAKHAAVAPVGIEVQQATVLAQDQRSADRAERCCAQTTWR